MPIQYGNTPSSADAMQTSLATMELGRSNTMSDALNNYSINLNVVHSGVDETYMGSTVRTISWDPGQAHQVVDSNGVYGIQSPAMALAHEIAHAIYGADENAATAFETQVAHELGEPTRADYNSVTANVQVTNSTEHTDNGKYVSLNLDGTTTVGPDYHGTKDEKTAPNMGAGTGGSGGGGGGGAAGGGGGGGDIVGVGDDMNPPKDGSGSHWQNPQFVTPHYDLEGTSTSVTLVGVHSIDIHPSM